MNIIKTSPRGFPFDELTLQELQDQTQPYIVALAKMIPDRSIVYGCEITQDEVILSDVDYLDGFIKWDGELLPFKGGPANNEFSILEEIQDRTFNLGTDADPLLEDHPAYVRRWAEIGNVVGAESVHLMSLLKPAPRFLTYLKKGIVWLGTVVPMISTIGGDPVLIVNVSFGTDILPTGNYMVFSSFYRTNAASQGDFDFDVYDRSANGFKLRLRNISEPVENLMYQYLVLPIGFELATVGP